MTKKALCVGINKYPLVNDPKTNEWKDMKLSQK